jgi:hypothetical protein
VGDIEKTEVAWTKPATDMIRTTTSALYPFLPLDPSLHSSPSRFPPAQVRFVRFLPSFLWGRLRDCEVKQSSSKNCHLYQLDSSPRSLPISPLCASLFRNPLGSESSLSLSATVQLLVADKTEIFWCKIRSVAAGLLRKDSLLSCSVFAGRFSSVCCWGWC